MEFNQTRTLTWIKKYENNWNPREQPITDNDDRTTFFKVQGITKQLNDEWI